RRAVGEHSTAREQDDARAEVGGQAEIMRRQDDRDAVRGAELLEERGDLELIPEIEGGGRLVEEQQRRSVLGVRTLGQLRHCRGKHYRRALAAAERAELTMSEGSRPSRLERSGSGREILRSLDLERAEVRVAAHERDLERAVVERQDRFLRHDREPARELA